ncbi:MAG: hypothetical protein ICV69_11210 [Thermoleophilaceae bacterium]|nr:hypothetical protein [Thermoleophilaceae bacterium]
MPADVGACLFHGDGVLTHTARAHTADRKQMLDDYPRQRAAQTGQRFVPARRGRRFLRRFGCTVRVDRASQADALRSHGGDVVVSDVVELLERP